MKKYSVGIDLGGTRVKLGLVAEGNIISQKIIPANSANGLHINLPTLQKEINNLLLINNINESNLNGIALAFPGLVDPVSNKILSTNQKYDDAISVDMHAWVKQNWHTNFYMDNDARMAAVGEWKFGEGKDTDNLVVMTIGTGIGTSAIIEGKLLRGKHFQAGVLGGHMSVKYNGRTCNCGNIGCAEAYGSSWSLKERLMGSKELEGSVLAKNDVHDFANLFFAAKNNDILALRLRQEYLDVWSATIINLIHAYDPEIVVLGGGVMNSGEDIIPYISSKVKAHAWTPWGNVKIKASKLLNDAGILGVVYCLENKMQD
jgi:glucokinase